MSRDRSNGAQIGPPLDAEKVVVVAHPDLHMQAYAEGFLLPYGIVVQTAATEANLLKLLSDKARDVRAVLLSEALPGTDLVELIKKLRGDDFFVPLVVLGDKAALSPTLERSLSRDHGVLSLEKRYDFLEFVELLKEFWD